MKNKGIYRVFKFYQKNKAGFLYLYTMKKRLFITLRLLCAAAHVAGIGFPARYDYPRLRWRSRGQSCEACRIDGFPSSGIKKKIRMQ
jgi:hypothetical protein